MRIRSSAPALLFLLATDCMSDQGSKSGNDGGTGGGTSTGSGWTRMYENTSIGAGDCITVDGNYIIVGTSKGVVVSNDDGATWTPHDTGLPDSPVVALIGLDDRVLAGMIGAPTVLVSTDHGSTWTQSASGLPTTTDAYAFFKTGTTVLLGMAVGSSDPGVEGGLFRSADKGGTWTKSSTGLPQIASATAFAMIGSTLFASTGSGLARSNDDGQSWQTQKLMTGNPLGLATLGGSVFVATSAGTSLDSTVLKSTDQGATWTDSGKGLPAKDPVDRLFVNGDNLYAIAFAQDDNGVYISTDSGASWQAYNDHLDVLGTGIPPGIVALAAHGKYLFALEDVGNVWRHGI